MGISGGLELRQGVARSLSFQRQRNGHQTHSPWGRWSVRWSPGLPESQEVKVGENMKCLGNEFWNETYISKGSEGRARAGELRRKAPRRGIEEPRSPFSGRALVGGGGDHFSESRPIMFLRAFLRLVLLGDLTAGWSSELCSSFRSSISMTTI